MNPEWLTAILADHATLDLHHADARETMALQILGGMPREAMLLAIRSTLMLKAAQAESSSVSVDDLANALLRNLNLMLGSGRCSGAIEYVPTEGGA